MYLAQQFISASAIGYLSEESIPTRLFRILAAFQINVIDFKIFGTSAKLLTFIFGSRRFFNPITKE